MDSTQPRLLSIKASARKLPIKRKIPEPSSNPDFSPIPNPSFVPKFESTANTDDDEIDDDLINGDDQKPPPFKFHRIWTESDEIRFLQGLLDCSVEGLYFPRDLPIFYARFSGTMSQPYTKSQLSEKLRRLRKKFRVTSARLSQGLGESMLSPHDRALFVLSKKLWHPEFESVSPFCKNSNNSNIDSKKKGSCSTNLVGVKVNFSPALPSNLPLSNETHSLIESKTLDFVDIDIKNDNSCGGRGLDYVNIDIKNGNTGCGSGDVSNDNVGVGGRDMNNDSGVCGGRDINNENDGGGDVQEDGYDEGDGDLDGDEQGDAGTNGDEDGNIQMNEVKVDYDFGLQGKKILGSRTCPGGGLGRVAAKTVIDVFDQSLKEVRTILVQQGLLGPDNGLASEEKSGVDLEKRWREQRAAELDVFACRLRLVLENSLPGR